MSDSKLASHLTWADVDGLVFVLDVRRGKYFGLSPDNSIRWRDLFDPGPSMSASSLHGSQDFSRAVDSMGWLERPDQSARWHSPRRPAGALVRRFPRCQALACLLGAHSRLRLGGFHKAYGWAQASPAAKQSNASNPVLLQSLLNAFYSAEHLIVSSLGLEDCLPRSLALFVFLRSYRLPVSHRIGVRRYPFRAHAWVEYDGRALLAPVVYGTSPRPGSAAAQPDFTPIARID